MRMNCLDNAYINGLDFDSRGALHVSWYASRVDSCIP